MGSLHDDGCGELIAFLEPMKVWPGHRRPSASAIQPLPPPVAHFVAEPRDYRRVPGDPIVAVVAAEFPGEHRVLPGDRRVSMLLTPHTAFAMTRVSPKTAGRIASRGRVACRGV